MNIVIIEDELPAIERLRRMLTEISPGWNVIATLTSVEEATIYLQQNEQPDIIFADIELRDGQTFNIFRTMRVQCPVIFITAHDEFWEAAFQQNSVDYLLKPVKKDRLAAAIQKYLAVKSFYQQQAATPGGGTFLVKKGTTYVPVDWSEMAYFFAFQKLVFLVTADGHKHVIQYTLNELEKDLDNARFCRVNRKFIVQRNAIQKIRIAPKSKLVLELVPCPSEKVIVSYENSRRIKQWMQQL